MILAQSPSEVEIQIEEKSTRQISVECSASIILTMLLLDDGTDYRPFRPLIISIDDVETNLPAEITSGQHTIKFLGEGFSGTKLLIAGMGLQALSVVTIEDQTVEVNIPQTYYRGYGPPDTNRDMVGKPDGTEYYDITGGITYKKREGTWIQLAS